LRLLFAGTPPVALPSLDALLASRHDVVAVLTRPAAPAGRGRALRSSPVAERAAAAGLPVLTPARPGEPAFLAELAGIAPDCCPVVGYGALVPPAALEVPASGWVNLHFSLLPAWRGAAPAQHALLAGDEVTGATTFRLEEGLDTGPVYGVLTEPVHRGDTAGELLARLATAGAELLVATLDGIEDGRLVPVPQPANGVSFAPRLAVVDFRVDWAAPAVRVDRLVRAGTPAPGAWTTFRGDRLKLGPVAVHRAHDPALEPGRLLLAGAEVLVGTGTTPARLGEVQPAGRSAVPAPDWARGVRLTADDRLA
jgi:methionyl-tRNA formyltransferase